MRKLVTLAAVMSLLALAVNVGPASADSETVPLYVGDSDCNTQPAGPATASSFVMLNTAGKPGQANDLIANIQLKNGLANTTYEVYVNGPSTCDMNNGGTFTTNKKGHGQKNVKVSGIDQPGGPHPFQVQLNQQGTGNDSYEFSSGVATLD